MRYLCIHGHFYQPPRENPWLEEIEVQDSAAPHHDWNERITGECYMPNAAARIVDHENKILDIVNNYAKISFNFGPTLLSWMERARPEVYQKILDADRISVSERGGHGNAIAQVYNHIIMPLASLRDKVTQVRWGIADFESRFNRRPEGMWLAETAVDLESLRVMAEEGIGFTILAPHQATRIRPIILDKEEERPKWEDVRGGKIDPTRPYRLFFSKSLFIDLFFYDGPISHSVAFDKLLQRGEDFVDRFRAGFSDKREWPQLLHIATDGESYGHHFAHGDMALAYTLLQIERQKIAQLTNYGEFLSKNAPTHEVEIVEGSSWSCAHGVERWRSNCGCRGGGAAEWNQLWRKPLREALDHLKVELDLLFEMKGKKWLQDPWATRDAYISMILKREKGTLTEKEVKSFLIPFQSRPLNDREREETIRLLEIQRNALLMFTSCAWFFDEISGLETTQVLKYAGRAIQLAKELDGAGFGAKMEASFVEKLKEAQSNIPEFGNGADIYQRFIKTARVDAKRIIAHFAIPSLFEETPQSEELYRSRLEIQDYEKVTDGTVTLAIGRARVTSKITFEMEEAIFGVLHFGGHDFHCAVGGLLDAEEYDRMKSELIEYFFHASQAAVVRKMDHYFGWNAFTLKDLFLETRRRTLVHIADRLFARYENAWRQIYLDHQKLMLYLQSTQAKIPRSFLASCEQVLTHDLKTEVRRLPDPAAFDRAIEIVQESERWGVELEKEALEARIQFFLEENLQALVEAGTGALLETIENLLAMADRARVQLVLWESQNLFHRFVQRRVRDKEIPSLNALERASVSRIAERFSYHVDPLL